MKKNMILAVLLVVGVKAFAADASYKLDNIDCYMQIQQNADDLRSELEESRSDYSLMTKRQRAARNTEMKKELHQISQRMKVINKIEKMSLPPTLSAAEIKTANEICVENQ